MTEDQVRTVAVAVLRSLYRTALTDSRGPTATVMESYSCFGSEACYHLTGLLEHQLIMNDPELPWSETIQRFAPQLREHDAIVDTWLDPHREPRPQVPAATPPPPNP